jgi:hypothetical protein
MALLYPIAKFDPFVKKGIFPNEYFYKYYLDLCYLDIRSIDTNLHYIFPISIKHLTARPG